MNKTIAMVANTSWNIYNFRLGLLKALQAEGYKIIVIAPQDAYSEKFGDFGFEFHAIMLNNKGTNPMEELKFIWHLYTLYKKLDIDVLLHYTIKPNIYGAVAAKILGIPVIANISGLGTVFLDESFSSKIARILYGFALRVPQKVFYQNRDDRDLFVQLGLVDRDKTEVLPGSGIDTQKYQPWKRTLSASERIKFLFVARLIGDKGIMEYVNAARQLQKEGIDAECAVLGALYPDNPTAITAEELALWEEEGVIDYLGVSDDVQEIMPYYDCVVLPSYREGLSRVLLEAASMQIPVIATNVPGCKDVVDDGVNGYLCKAKDVYSLAEKMKKMASLHVDERLAMGIKGRKKMIAFFDEKFVIEKYLKALSEIFFQKS